MPWQGRFRRCQKELLWFGESLGCSSQEREKLHEAPRLEEGPGEKTAKRHGRSGWRAQLLDSDCESCASRRGKATRSAAKAASAYVRKIKERKARTKKLPLMSEDEGKEDEEEVEVEEPDADHDRATALKKVSSPLKFSTASGDSLPNLGTTEMFLSGPSPDGSATRCRCIFNVAAVQRCLLSTGRAMDRGNALVFAGKEAVLFLRDGRSLLFEEAPARRSACSLCTLTGSRQRKAAGAATTTKKKATEKKEGRGETEYYNLFPEPEIYPIFSAAEDEEAQPYVAEPASGSGQQPSSARPLRSPPVPTPQMIAEHEVTHIPYRSWCPACVAGRGRAYSHHHKGRESSVPVISADYLFFSDKGTSVKILPTVVLRDRTSKAIFSHLLPAKGTSGSTFPEKAVLRDLSWLGSSSLG